AGLLALAGVLGVGEGHLLHRKALRVKSADFAKSGSLFQSFLRHISDGQLGDEPKCPKKSQEEFVKWKQRQKKRRQQRIDQLNNQGV
ncbi:hypothetical protein RZ767_034615, partial [Pseudomonas aeruginosa]|nr:hypothetical protein [Pseudomonas aeruginosa]